MKTEVIPYLIILILGIVTAIAPWTFAPVCMTEMRCYFTRDVMTVLGASISVVALLGMYKSME
ncbi:MAG: DUF4418 family protein [Anaerolineales bacterium]|nr:DUF4418 family protein [Anaerolineales bacterium]